jgi:hypothetical protein
MSEALQAAIEDVYRVFSAPPPQRIEGCPCCSDPAELRVLHTKPLRDLTSDELGQYTSSALLTVGSESDVRYFLPRILELAVLEPDAYPNIEIRLDKLWRMGWRTWPAWECEPLERFVREWLESLLAKRGDDARNVDALVCGAARAEIDIDPMLVRIGQAPDMAQTLFELNSTSFWKHGGPSNAFWPQIGPARDVFIRWLEKMARG